MGEWRYGGGEGGGRRRDEGAIAGSRIRKVSFKDILYLFIPQELEYSYFRVHFQVRECVLKKQRSNTNERRT